MLNTYKAGKLMYVLKTPDGIAEWKKDPEAMMDLSPRFQLEGKSPHV